VEVGEVVDGDRHMLKVRRKDQTEIWLSGKAILATDDARVTLICYASGVGRWGAE
jgi:hypothetical protein